MKSNLITEEQTRRFMLTGQLENFTKMNRRSARKKNDIQMECLLEHKRLSTEKEEKRMLQQNLEE